MHKVCPLFFRTKKKEFIMHVQSLNIDLSNAAICRLACSSAFMKEDLLSCEGFFPQKIGGEGRGGGREDGASLSVGNFRYPCSAVPVYQVLDTHTSSYRKLSYAGTSHYELRQEQSFLLFNKQVHCFVGFYIP